MYPTIHTDNATRWVIGSLGEEGRDNTETKPRQNRDNGDNTETKAETKRSRSGPEQQQQYTLSPGFVQGASATSRYTGLALAHTYTSLQRISRLGPPPPNSDFFNIFFQSGGPGGWPPPGKFTSGTHAQAQTYRKQEVGAPGAGDGRSVGRINGLGRRPGELYVGGVQ